MTRRTPSIDDSVEISRRMAEIQQDRMVAIAGCNCQRNILGEYLHRDNCPLRTQPPSQGSIITTLVKPPLPKGCPRCGRLFHDNVDCRPPEEIPPVDPPLYLTTAVTLTPPEVETLRRRWLAMCKGTLIAVLMALAFDPHILILSYGAERQERIPATSRATCTAAIDAIHGGRWLADDPPLGMRCEQGNAFAPGSDCIKNYNCGGQR